MFNKIINIILSKLMIMNNIFLVGFFDNKDHRIFTTFSGKSQQIENRSNEYLLLIKKINGHSSIQSILSSNG